ncbi:MAG: ATP-binding protein [Candidatus Methylomirabilales bacterium]
MKCRTCPAKAVIEVRRHNAAFCKGCFIAHVERQVQKTIETEKMLSRDDRVLVAISGGKDSLTLWEVLHRLGYSTTGFHLALGIGDYSPLAREKVEAYAKGQGLPLIVSDVKEEYDFTIPELALYTPRVPCSACGLSKRYLMNRSALEGGFTVLATGHNLDDAAATLLGNLLHWQTEQLGRMRPAMEATHPKLVKTVKPLIRLTERETLAYTMLRGIDYHEDECPNAVGATSLVYKDLLNQLEHTSPGAKQSFYYGFLKKGRAAFLATQPDGVHLTECAVCGQATTTEACAFCRMMEQARRKAASRNL